MDDRRIGRTKKIRRAWNRVIRGSFQRREGQRIYTYIYRYRLSDPNLNWTNEGLKPRETMNFEIVTKNNK